MKIAFYTLGCKVNQYETNGMIQKFIEAGHEITDFSSKADIYIINTCTVTNMSDRKSRQMLRRAKELNPEALVVAVGCYVQVAKKQLEEIKEIDLCLGTNEKANIVQEVEEYLKNKTNLDRKENTKNDNNLKEGYSKLSKYDEFGNIYYTEKTRAVIKVQDGCDRFCSYCIIPYARGKVRSRLPENIIAEVKDIVKNGYKEIVVTGIHVASYGKDFENNKLNSDDQLTDTIDTAESKTLNQKNDLELIKYGLIDLLEELDRIEGLERIRLGSIEPLWINDNIIKRLSKLNHLCHHFHLSLQSGCTDTLKRMNRRYTAEEFETIASKLRNAFDDCILTTDIIVGFPGETNQEFDATYEFLQKIKFYKTHVFKYSKRNGTVAAQMSNQVDGKIQEERSNKLLQLSDKNEIDYLDSFINTKLKVLIEEFDGEYYKGHTSNYIMLKVKSDKDITNQIRDVIALNRDNLELIGELN